MPIYEYVCNKCEQKFEALVHGGEQVLCPSCKSPNISKQFSTFATSTKDTTPEAPVCSPGGCRSCAFNDN